MHIIFADYAGHDMRVFDQIAAQNVQLISQRIIMFRESLNSCVVSMAVDDNLNFSPYMHIARNRPHDLSEVFRGFCAVQLVIARHRINGDFSRGMVINMYIMGCGGNDLIFHRIVGDNRDTHGHIFILVAFVIAERR